MRNRNGRRAATFPSTSNSASLPYMGLAGPWFGYGDKLWRVIDAADPGAVPGSSTISADWPTRVKRAGRAAQLMGLN